MKNKIHICLCYHLYTPISGGVELNMQKISEYLINKSYKVTVLCSDKNNKNKKEETINGVKVIYVKAYFNIFKVPFAPLYWYELSKMKPDLIHAFGTSPGFSDVSIIYAKIFKIPCLLSYRFDGNAESLLGQFFAYIYNSIINKIVVKLADKITTTGISYASTSLVLKGIMDKVTIITNGIDLKLFNRALNKKKGGYSLPKGKIILWVGRFVKYKGLGYLIKSMKYVPEGTLIIIGSGVLEKKLKELTKKKNLRKKIQFIGHIDNEELPYFYHKAYVYVLSSITRGENCTNSSLEAMSCGTPVIASDLPGVRDLITDNVGFRVQPKDSRGIAEKINYLFANETIRERMSKEGVRKAQNYSWGKVNKKYLDLYKELLHVV
jgi:glycosyltransferase involved in cell wall biosynthesis